MSYLQASDAAKYVIKELEKQTNPPLVDSNISILSYYNRLWSLRQQGASYEKMSDWERAFVCTKKLARVYLSTIKEHKHFLLPKYSQEKIEYRKMMEKAVADAERFYELIILKYDNFDPDKEETEGGSEGGEGGGRGEGIASNSLSSSMAALSVSRPPSDKSSAPTKPSNASSLSATQNVSSVLYPFLALNSANAASTTTLPSSSSSSSSPSPPSSAALSSPTNPSMIAPNHHRPPGINPAAAASTLSNTTNSGYPNLAPPSSSSLSASAPPPSSSSITIPPKKLPRIPKMDEMRTLFIPQNVMAEFMKLAEKNTIQGIETCGILGGILKGNSLYVTHCILPKQCCTANTCATTDENQLIDIQLKYDLLTVGWIHTHPTQTCFLSSVDLHTHYSYQIMMQEAVAIVMAPTAQPNNGTFHITAAGLIGLSSCNRTGFHKHEETYPLYGPATHVKWNQDKITFIDVR